jgi:D-lactate dehydrogenase (cytochrome)
MSGGMLANVEVDYPDYLRDESRRVGRAETISFPTTEEELVGVLSDIRKAGGTLLTVQGARTGITGGAVPDGGHVLNLSRMNRVLGLSRADSEDTFLITVQPGVLLADLRQFIEKKEFDTAGWSDNSLDALAGLNEKDTRFFFPPDPTETSASIGGMVACNASGARSLFYGPTRKYVERARVIMVDGSALDLRRRIHRAVGRTFSLETDTGRVISGALPTYSMPKVKSAAGYFVEDDMDILDLFIGSEGTLGIVSEIELRLVPSPETVWGVMTFFPEEQAALHFVRELKTANCPTAMEFFDCRVLALLREQKRTNPAFKEIPDIPVDWNTAVYVEFHGNDADSVENAVMEMSETMTECGGDGDATWLADNDRELERLKAFRHAVPEAVNLLIDERRKKEPGLTKLGTDLAVPDSALEEMIGLYHKTLDEHGLAYVVFGHIGDNHLHVNIIPDSLVQYEQGRNLYIEWARAAIGLGGTVSAEHGIGKLKKPLLLEMYGEDGIEQMRQLKRLFDPEGLFNPGNLF